jgi:hypothetical protein
VLGRGATHLGETSATADVGIVTGDRADHRTGDRYASSGNRREEPYDIGQGKPAGKALDKGAALVADTYEALR